MLHARVPFPTGHVIGITYAKVFGPTLARTPSGEPIQISSGPFDNTVETALSAIKRAANKWHSIVQSADSDWLLTLEEDIIHPVGRPPVPYERLYFFRYLPEASLWAHLGLDESKVHNHFHTSYYVTRKHLTRTSVDQSLATTLYPAKEIT
jgi:hypothetical protein